VTEPVRLTASQKRSRRRKTHNECLRESCPRGVLLNSGEVYCGALCRYVDRELSNAQRVCGAVGPGAVTTELWLAAVSLSSALGEYQRLERKLSTAAREVGIDEAAWQAIRHGMP
jgi:hypothetical protein